MGPGIKPRQRRRAEAAERLQALGSFAGGIAHDFHNTLIAIEGLLDMALAEAPKGGRTAEHLAAAKEAVEQASLLARRILAFARGEAPRRERIDLARTVRRGLDLVRAGLPRHIALEARIESVGEVMGDPVRLQQVLLNLGANAAAALGKCRGRIEVRLDRVSGAGVGRPQARLVFRDDGPGFPPELRERIFEPFFTTKPEGAGTGLGLALAKDIVAWHGGRIEAESRPGEGAAFILHLPLARPRRRA